MIFLLALNKLKSWVLAAWAWLKKYWVWVLFPVGLLLLLLRWRRQPDVLVPELVGASEAESAASEKAARETASAQKERDEKIKQVEESHAEVLQNLTEEQKERAEELREDPEELNDFLLSVGKSLRQP